MRTIGIQTARTHRGKVRGSDSRDDNHQYAGLHGRTTYRLPVSRERRIIKVTMRIDQHSATTWVRSKHAPTWALSPLTLLTRYADNIRNPA